MLLVRASTRVHSSCVALWESYGLASRLERGQQAHLPTTYQLGLQPGQAARTTSPEAQQHPARMSDCLYARSGHSVRDTDSIIRRGGLLHRPRAEGPHRLPTLPTPARGSSHPSSLQNNSYLSATPRGRPTRPGSPPRRRPSKGSSPIREPRR